MREYSQGEINLMVETYQKYFRFLPGIYRFLYLGRKVHFNIFLSFFIIGFIFFGLRNLEFIKNTGFPILMSCFLFYVVLIIFGGIEHFTKRIFYFFILRELKKAGIELTQDGLLHYVAEYFKQKETIN